MNLQRFMIFLHILVHIFKLHITAICRLEAPIPFGYSALLYNKAGCFWYFETEKPCTILGENRYYKRLEDANCKICLFERTSCPFTFVGIT